MRKGYLLAAALLCIGCPASKNAKAPKAGDIRQITMPEESSPFVNFRVVFLAGSIDDPKGKEGLTSLTAHLYAEGGTKDLSYPEILKKLYPLSAELSVHVDKEVTVFQGRVHRDLLDDFYPIFRDVLIAPRLDQENFTRLKDKALSELTFGLKQNDDEALGKAALEAMIYEGHPYAHPIVGTEAGLRAITLDDVKAQAARLFTQDRVLVGLAGAYLQDFPQKVLADLSALPAKGAPRVELPSPQTHARPRVLIVEKETASTAISFGFPIALTRADEDFAALDIARSYFGEHRQFHGVLFKKMRGDRGLNYGNYAYIEAFTQEGWSTLPLTNTPRRQQFFSVWIRPVQPQHGVFALKQAMRELDRLVQEGLSQESFEATRNFLTGYTRLYEETESRRLGYALDDRFYGLKAPHLSHMREKWKTLSVADTNQALQKYLKQEGVQIAFVTKDAQGLKEALLSKAPTTIEYASPKDASILEEDKLIGAYDLGLEASDIQIIKVADLFVK